MNAIVIRKIDPPYLKRLARYNFISAFFTTFFILGSFFWMYKQIGGQHFNQIFANAVYALSSFIGAGWSFQTLYRGRYGPLRFTRRYQMAWLLICLGLICNGIGGLCYWYLENIGDTTFPSWADVLFMLYYPLFFVGFLLIPAQARFRFRMAIDAVITTCSILGVSWFFLIGPQYFQQAPHATSLEKMTSLAVNLSYPTLDAISLLALFLLVQRKMEKSFTIPYLLLILAQFCSMWANGAYAYLNIFESYQTGNAYVDTFWFIGPLLCGMAGLYHYTALVSEALQNEERLKARAEIASSAIVNSHWKTPSLHVYIPFIALLVLSTYAELFHNGPITNYLIVLTLLVSIIVAARYLLATRENAFYLQEREQQRRDSENLRLLATHLNQILDIDRLLERTISLAIEELDFTMAILILAPRQEQDASVVQVLAASNTAPISTWYIYNNAFLLQMAQIGKELELHWARHMSVLAPDVRTWLQQQPYTSSYFLPLYYQNKLLGCLGITYRLTPTFKQRALILARAYCDEIATIIEHTRLYQKAREHETFANAMTTIAVRLNSAVVEPAEVGRLICQEGARALQADYVLLYLLNEQKLLEPYALSINETQKDSSLKNLSELKNLYDLKNWPQIHPYEYEAQTLYASEPLLRSITLPAFPDDSHSRSESDIVRERQTHQAVTSHYSQISTFHKKLMQLGVSTTLQTALIVREKPAGILVFARAEYRGTNESPPFDTTDIPQVRDFMAQARVAFTNARLYQRLKTAHKQLQELDQLKDQFMIMASHELRTPLTAVQGYVELLTNFGDELSKEQYQEFLHKARQGCEELAILLSNIMDASRLEVDMGLRPMYTTQIQVDEIIKSILIIIEPQMKQEKREVYLHLPEKLAVMADPVRLRQVLMNISTNALKYSDPPAPIHFLAQVSSETGQVIISIIDKGKGIALEEQGRVFERFYRMENDINSSVRGSGLGLYISKRLLEAMGGKIWIESRGIAGEGSTFHIQLPMA